jgi:hypothetical protein
VRPDYSYFSHARKKASDELIFIKKINLLTSEEICVLSDNDVIDLLKNNGVDVFSIKYYWINHIMASPENDKFIFLVRYFLNNQKKHILCLYDDTKGSISILLYDCIISHFNWLNNNIVVVHLTSESFVGYRTINVMCPSKFLDNYAYPDGHPSKYSDGIIITDTYPDRFSYQSILLIDLKVGTHRLLKKYASPPFYVGAVRCDLHPVFDASSSLVIVDIIYKGRKIIDVFSAKNYEII